jgi:UDP-N-acetylglucosamine 1-carboxyvinyltransferase
VQLVHGFVEASCDGLRGSVLHLEYPSHGATENLLIASVLAQGRTIIENASREPEICDLARFLTKMGARIDGAGTTRLEIEGVDRLEPVEFEVMPDRLEAATFLFAVGTVGGDVTVRRMEPSHLEIVLERLAEMGAEIETGTDHVRMKMDGRPIANDISTLPYPGFPTDLQPMAVAMLTKADGVSIVTENIYDSRFFYIDELARMGADVRVSGHYAVVRGVDGLMGAPVKAHDVSAGAALVMAGLAATGKTVVEDIVHIDRRYENLEGKLASLGGRIERVESAVRV